MTAKEFYGCTYREFMLRLDGYALMRSHSFEGARAICYHIALVNWDTKKAPMPTMTEYMPLLTDDKEESVSSKETAYDYAKELLRKARENNLL